LSYRVCYRACAGGPFSRPEGGGRVTRRLDGAPQGRLELWDNDGIVNTLSMLWPKTENVLVAGDHLDIVGHYRLVEVDDNERDCCPARRYRSYDLLRSKPPFGTQTFEKIWTEIFDFSAGREHREAPRHTLESVEAKA
jgi:hypothetical protein